MPVPTSVGRMPDPVKPEPAVPTNPFSYIAGMAKNLVGDVGEMVSGVTGLIQAGVHDITAGVEELIPGQQQAEKEGYTFAKIAKGFIPAIMGDYAHRYGGLTNIARGLYEDPLSYIMDALIVAGGVGAVGEAGRGSGILAKLPTLVSDETAQRILGPALTMTTDEAGQTVYRVAKYGTAPFASTELGSMGVEGLKLSKNPLTRTIQEGMYKGLSMPAVSPKLALADWANTTRAMQTIDAAEQAGMRVLRPTVSKYLAGHQTSIFLSANRLNKSDLTQNAIKEVDEILHPTTGVTADGSTVGGIVKGTATPPVLPVLDPVDVPFQTVGRLPEPLGVGQFDPGDAIRLTKRYGFKEDFAAPATPFAEVGGGGSFNRFQIPVSSLDEAEAAALDAMKTLEAKPLGVYDTLGKADEAWDGLHFYGQKLDGQIVEISVGTPDMLRQQSAASKVLNRVSEVEGKRVAAEADLERAMQNVAEGDLPAMVAKADEYRMLAEEVYAGKQWAKMIFDDTRAQWWADRGVAAYDGSVKAAYRLRPWINDQLEERWFHYFPDQASYVTMMERAYGPQRVNQFYGTLTKWAPEIRTILSQNVPDTQIMTDLLEYLKIQGLPDELAGQVLGKFSFRGVRGERGIDAAVTRLMKRARGELWDYTVVEGGRGAAYGFPEYDWRVMNEARAVRGLPLPSYMPDLPAVNASEYLLRPRTGTGVSLSRASRPGITKNWKGLLMEEGRVEQDAFEIYRRSAAIMINHQETQDLLDKILTKFGRKMTRQEVALAREYGNPRYAGEVFISPQMVKSQLSMRSELMSDTLAGMADHGDLQRATLDSVDSFASKVFESGTNNLVNGEVWAVPKSVAEMVRREVRLQLGPSMKLFWDTPMNLWKASVLSLSPRWVVNNFFGNLIFMGIENPGALRYAISQLDKKNRALAETILGPEAIRATERGFFHNLQRVYGTEGRPALTKAAHVAMGRVTEEMGAGAARAARYNYAGRWVGGWSDMVRMFNSNVEEAARRGILLENVRKLALKDWVSGFHSSYQILEKVGREAPDARLLDQAITSVDRTLGNFMRYSPVEQGIIRRFLVPFYGFYRHMAKVVALMPIEHPVKGRVLELLAKMNDEMETSLPEYLRDQGAVFLGDLWGKDTLVRLKNLNPLSQINEQLPLVGLLNPAVKVAIERSLGVDSFTGDAFATPEDVVQTHDGRYWQIERDGAGNIIGVQPATKPLPNVLSHVGSQFGVVSMLPGFQRYPKSVMLNIASWAGLPMTQPKRSLESSRQFDEEMQKEALSLAGVSSDPFASSFSTEFPF